ncbi:hypothetical protein EGR_01329 [Echinococcus granulosus]|uniref:Transmembrane protein n=1 Tax=Echinococcus granulosus TaxID=6210 RepID=U6J2G4_ECHGR|nr:hypothetical protein EGR_01329 [Echinococcus granulosus]EUB63706.1 hypothetical protein EGR_01329 [Echinococcus granulosus]CDS15859.1 hypothetical protein EgrG_000826850 [Echinococcus granulosus]
MPKSREMPIMLIDTQGLHTPLSFLLLSIFLGSLYLVLFIAFLMLCLCKPKREQFIVPGLLFQGPNLLNSRASSLSSALTEAAKSSTSALMVEDPSLYASPTRENSRAIHSPCRLPATDSIPTTRKILIFLYVCFRAFTIFLFTFSVGLSVLLSIESESFKTLVSCVQNAKSDRIRELVSQEAIRRTFSAQNSRRIASPWLKELRQIEKASDIELSSQTTNFIRQTSACEMQELRVSGEVGLSMAEVASLVSARTDMNISGNKLSQNDPQNFVHYIAIANITWDYLESEYWSPHNISIQRYMEDTRGLLDNQMVQHWSPYTLLLERMLDNPWLATARRAMNATNDALQSPEIVRFSVRSPSVPEYFAGLTPADPQEVEALTFSGFLGIPQPANARYAEARMWNSLRQNVHTLKLLRYFENVKNTESSVFTAQVFGLSQSPDPFKYYTYGENFTTDDLDSLSSDLAASILRDQVNQRSLTAILATGNKNKVSSLREWINVAYLRVFLLVLDAYLIVSRFYSACCNFCALWLGKRRRVYHSTHQKLNAPKKRQTLNEHPNDALLLTSSEIEQPNLPNETDLSACPTTCPAENNAQNNISPHQPPPFDEAGNQSINAFSDHTDSQYVRAGNSTHASATVPHHTITATELSNDPEAADFTEFNRRRSLPACCCCLDFHYLLILFGICLMIVGFVISSGAGKGLVNSWLLKRSALLSRVEAMDDYRRHMRAMVHYVQLNYLNSQRLLLERNKSARQLRRLQRIQHWLYYEKEYILRRNLYEVCALSESKGRNRQSFYVLDSSICHRIRQDQQRRQHSPYSSMASRKLQKSTTSFMSSQDQLKLPFCTLLPVQSTDAVNSSLSTRERHTILGTEKSTSVLSEQELRQLHQMFFKNSAFAAFLTSLYRLLFTTLLLSMCICWLLACKHLIMQMATRTVAVVTSRVTVISPCPPGVRRIETFISSPNSSLSFHRPVVEGIAPTRLNIWHFDDDPSKDFQNPHYLPAPDLPPHVPKHSASHSLMSSVSRKKSKKHFHFKGKLIQAKTQTDSTESQV